jgi:signal peptidase II
MWTCASKTLRRNRAASTVDRTKRRAATLLFGTAAAVLLFDRLTKTWAEHVLAGHPIEIVSGFLTLRFTTNPGGAFSLGQNLPWLFATASVAVAGLIVITAFRHTDMLTAVALGLVLGGTLGNLSDRLIRGSSFFGGRVVDFIDFHWWPVFNVADSAIVIGAVILAFSSWRAGRRRAQREAEPSAGSDAG